MSLFFSQKQHKINVVAFVTKSAKKNIACKSKLILRDPKIADRGEN